ncbi:glycosyltransferase family 2 protein [Chitinophagaceae bacterium LB-8]|uniref:Glycosyltransferase family 2 protein n=1 Tax=Paraflavisolibacter caeni TaxID=2982496 RepID=A0A9X2XX20_9BACT|nr:glycosyltransferase family 2 protein [Paraflavisolibacter caeni]MCU7550856.1 glycosyltransferase family 2 protein [Paraflavisolibacter caeni]
MLEKVIHTAPVQQVSTGSPKVSAVIITYNEEHILNKTLSQLWWCDEIIIIDSGSTDKTVEICKQFGCKIFTRTFNGYGEQKKYGVSNAKNDWILCLDADEVLSGPLIEEINTELSKNEMIFAGFEIPRTLVYVNKPFRYGKEANDLIIRLFNRNKGGWDGSIVHEKMILKGKLGKLSKHIFHYSYFSYAQHLNKINEYSSLGATKLLQKNKYKSRLIVTLAIPFNFFKYYILHRNFLNGFHGLAWAILSTLSHFLKYAKLYELKKNKDS